MDDDKNILSIDSNDDGISYLSLTKHLEEDTERRKNKVALEIEEMGDQYLNEIDKKKRRKKLKQAKLIPFIIKHRGDFYDEQELMSYSYNDVEEIYNEIKAEKKSGIVKFFRFLLGTE